MFPDTGIIEHDGAAFRDFSGFKNGDTGTVQQPVFLFAILIGSLSCELA